MEHVCQYRGEEEEEEEEKKKRERERERKSEKQNFRWHVPLLVRRRGVVGWVPAFQPGGPGSIPGRLQILRKIEVFNAVWSII